MTISRTGLMGRRTARNGYLSLITRDRQDGGGGGRDDIDTGDDTDDDGDDDGEDVEDDGDDDSDDSDDSDDDDKPLGPKGEKALAALKEKNKALRQQLRQATAKDDGDADEKVTAARAEEAATWKPLLVKQAARAQLQEAGLLGKPDRLLRLLDLDDIDVDPKTGEIDGLDEQIEDFRKEYRELFRKKGSSRIDASDRDRGRDTDEKKLSATERQAAQLRR